MAILQTYPAAVDPFRERSLDHSGLDFAFGAGRFKLGATVTDISAGTVTLTDDDTNYIEVDTSTDAVVANTTGFTGDNIPLFTVVTASGEIDTVTDKRTFLGRPVSEILTTKGDILVFDGMDYQRLAVGSDDEVLTVDSAEAVGLKWGSGGGAGIVEDEVIPSSDTTDVQLTVPADLREFEIIINQFTATTAGPNYGIRFNGDDGANYQNRRWNSYGTNSDAIDQEDDSAMFLVLRTSSDVESPQFVRAVVSQPDDDEPVFLEGHSRSIDNLGMFGGHWIKGTGERIATVDIYNAFGDQIPAGTVCRIIRRV